MIIVPGKMGICVYSPLLDQSQNSVRGVQFAKMISDKFSLHGFTIKLCSQQVSHDTPNNCKSYPFVQASQTRFEGCLL